MKSIKKWRTIVRDELSTGFFVKDMANKLHERTLSYNFASGSSDQRYYWSSIEHTYIALLFGYLHSVAPESDYEKIAHKHLSRAVQNNNVVHSISLFGGLTQIGMCTHFLNSLSGRYDGLLSNIDTAVNMHVSRLVDSMIEASESQTLTSSAFDLIEGLTGVAVYLLCRKESPVNLANLHKILQALSDLARQDTNGVFKFKTSKNKLVGSLAQRSDIEGGVLNCGLAHGISGVLSILSLSKQQGISIDGLDHSIEVLANSLVEYSIKTDSGHSWMDVVPLDAQGNLDFSKARAMDAWCYGTLGVARALWLGGVALRKRKWRKISVDATKSALTRLGAIPMTDVSLCHGIAGALLTALRFWNDTNDDFFRTAALQFYQMLMAQYRSEQIFGFRDYSLQLPDNAGFLTGSCGITLVLLAACFDIEPTWDRLMLYS